MPLPRMENYRPIQVPRNSEETRAHAYREASVGNSQSASSNSDHRTRHRRHEPDLREPLNKNRGLEAYQPDLRDRLNDQRDQACPLGYLPTMSAMPAIPANDPAAAIFAYLATQIPYL